MLYEPSVLGERESEVAVPVETEQSMVETEPVISEPASVSRPVSPSRAGVSSEPTVPEANYYESRRANRPRIDYKLFDKSGIKRSKELE